MTEQPTSEPCEHHPPAEPFDPIALLADHEHCSRCGLAVWPDVQHECPPAFTR